MERSAPLGVAGAAFLAARFGLGGIVSEKTAARTVGTHLSGAFLPVTARRGGAHRAAVGGEGATARAAAAAAAVRV